MFTVLWMITMILMYFNNMGTNTEIVMLATAMIFVTWMDGIMSLLKDIKTNQRR